MADTKISDLDAVTDVQDTDEFVLARAGESKKIDGVDLRSEVGGGGGLFASYAVLQDQKAANTNGGDFTSGAWQTRVLNTEVFDPDGIVSLSSNQFTLGDGTYLIRARAPAYATGRHQAKIRNVTDSTDDIVGASVYSNNTAQTQMDATVVGRFTIAGSKTFELQHQCENTSGSGLGFGVGNNFGLANVFSVVEIWKEA